MILKFGGVIKKSIASFLIFLILLIPVNAALIVYPNAPLPSYAQSPKINTRLAEISSIRPSSVVQINSVALNLSSPQLRRANVLGQKIALLNASNSTFTYPLRRATQKIPPQGLALVANTTAGKKQFSSDLRSTASRVLSPSSQGANTNAVYRVLEDSPQKKTALPEKITAENAKTPQTKKNPFPALANQTTGITACTKNGYYCSCTYGCSTTQCCSGSCDYNTCLDYGCYKDYPNLCSGYCYGKCESSSTFICDASDGVICCPDTHPYYCNTANSCYNTPYKPDNPCGTSCHPSYPYYCASTNQCYNTPYKPNNPCGSCSPDYPIGCNGDCYTCTSGTLCCPSNGAPQYCCGNGQICQSDGSCLTPECTSNSGCQSDTYYCSGDNIMFRDNYCSSYKCKYSDSVYTNCNDYDRWICADSKTKAYADHTCAVSGNTIGCGYTLTNHQTCQYQCSDGQCVTPSTTTVSGYFKKSNGNGISNVKFKLEDCGNHAVRAYDNTDSSGYYSMNAAAGNYQLAADYLGFDIHFGSCTNFVGTVNIADITLKASLSGYTKYSSGSGRSGVVVRLKDCSNNLINSQTTNSNGYYQVSASDAGNYKVTMELLGQEFEVLGCQPMIENMQAPDAVFDASLSGYVKNGNGVGKSNVLMKLTTCGGTTVASTTTDNTGYFTLHAADAGSFDLIMNYQGKNYEIIDCAQIVGTTSLQNPITLSAAISGTITDNAGNGKSNLNVKLTDCSGNAIHVAKTNSNGYFKVLSAEPGSFDLYFDYNGYTFQLLDCYPVFGEVSFQNPIKLSTKLYGYLHDLNSNPLKDYAVELYDCSENFVKSGLTGSNGYFSITENAGKYKIFIDIGSGWKTKLIDDKNNDCHFLIGDINLGTLKINPSVDCSVYNYKCYQGNIKLFNCYWDKANRVCACYGTPCDYGCTDGKQDCDAAKTGVVVIDVDDVTDNPIHGARIFLNDKYQGATDGNGKLNVAAPLGYQTFEADCPDQSFCGKKQVYVDGTKYLYFDCNCKNLDSDGDTLTDEEERIIGLDPYNSQSNLISGYTDMDISTSCFDFKPLFSGLFSEQEINRFIQNINGSGQNYQMLFETAISPRALQTMYGLDSRKLVTDSRKTMAMLKESSKIQYVSSGASAVLIMTDDISGVTSIFPIAAACAGQIIGVLAGAGFGLKDDFEGVFTLGKTLLTGLWHIITRQKKISSLWDDVVNVVKAIGSILKNADKLVHDMTMGIFGKGKWVLDIVNAKTGSDEYLSFQLGFFSGYVVGYVVEQIALFEAILSKASQVFTKIAQGTKLGKAITNVAKALERIGSKFGGRVAESLSNLKIWNAAASWADEVQDGLAILAKNIDESWFAQKSSSYLERISKSVSELYNSLDVSLRPALDGLLKNNGLRDKILPLFEAWDTAVKARRGLVRIFEEFGDSALDSLLKKYTDTNVLKSIAQTADTLLSSGKVNGLSKTVKLNIVEEIGLIGTKYGDAVADDLIKNSDVFLKAAQTPDGKSIFLRKGNIEVVVEYVDDGGGYLKKIGINIADTSNANKGKIGEIITDNIARKQGWGEVVPGFMKDNTNQIGIDRIYKKGDTYILVESKFTSDTNLQNVGRSILDTTTDYGKQMSDAWIQNAVDTMLNDNIITPQLAAELKKAIPANIRKKLVVVKNSPPTGYTVLDDLETYIDPVSNTALGIKDVSIINIGKVI